jgi:tetratricopeptide (TPR) repeat protein
MRYAAVFVILIFSLFGCGWGNNNTKPDIEYGNPFQKHVKDLPVNQFAASSDEQILDKANSKITAVEYEKLGDAALSRGNYYMAFVKYEKALQEKPKTLRIEYKKGLTLLYSHKNDDAVTQFRLVRNMDPSFALTYEGLGQAYFQKKDWKAAETHFKKAVALKSNLYKSHNFLGNIYDYQGDYENAIREFKIAISIEPNHGFLFNNLGIAYALSGRHEKAVEAFRKAIEKNYTAQKVYNNSGLSLANLGRYEEALEAFKKGGGEARAHNNLGTVYLKQGKVNEARQHFKKAIEISPKYYVTAGENLKKAMAAHPDDALSSSALRSN